MSADTAFARLREANPVPRPEALRETPHDVAGFLLATRQRSTEMDTKLQERTTTEKTAPARRRLIPALAAFVVVIVAVGSFLLVTRDAGPDVVAENIAREFFTAKNAGDADAAIALFAPDAVIDDPFVGDTVQGYREDIAWSRAVGGQDVIGECTTNPAAKSSSRHLLGYSGTEARCTYALENDWTRALGLGGFQPTADYRFVVENGLIVHLIHDPENSAFSQAWEAFRSWLLRNHPEDATTMYEVGETAPRKDAAAIELWGQRTAEFVADQ